MLRFHGLIPITIHPIFWLFASLIGFLYSQTLIGTFIWVAIIFFSVLFHELGHASTALFFGRKPRIELVALGGLTIHNGQNLSAWKQFLIVLNGPIFGFLLAVIAWYAMKISFLSVGLPAEILRDVAVINVFWTIVNLLPILPLDGGQMLRIALEAFFGTRGLQYSLVVGIILSVLISLTLFLFHDFLLGSLFFLFAFQSFEMWRSTRRLSESDRKESFKELFLQGQTALLKGDKEEAIRQFQALREQAKRGILRDEATQQLALLHYEKGEPKQAYALLQEVQRNLDEELALVLHELAFGEGNYALVVSLAPRVFRSKAESAVALRSAYAASQLKLVKPAIGWLQAALECQTQEEGGENKEILTSPLFDPIRKDPLFLKFLEKN